MGRITDFDHFAVGDDLDIASWDSYPLGFLEDRSVQGEDFKHKYMRQGDPDFQAFHHDLYRAVGKGRWWVMEQQPGPVNWAPYNPAPLTGMVRLWTWEAIAHGAEVVSYFRWRQAPFGQEQMHGGLQRPDGEWADAAGEVMNVAKEILDLNNNSGQLSAVALVFDYKSAWAWDIQPQGRSFDYFSLIYDFYRGLRRLGLSVDILSPDTKDFSDYNLICIPGLFTWTAELTTAINNFSGQVLIGPRSGSKNEDFKISENLPPNVRGFKCKIKAVETLRPGSKVKLQSGGAFKLWREFAETSERVDEVTDDGEPAIISNRRITYLTGWPDDEAMTRILSQTAIKAEVDIKPVNAGQRRREFGDFTLLTNYDNGEISLINNATKERLF